MELLDEIILNQSIQKVFRLLVAINLLKKAVKIRQSICF